MRTKFPQGFYFGASTSSHQVEGGTHNDWTLWEHENSERLTAETAYRHTSGSKRIPDSILYPSAGGPSPLEKENYVSGQACDHYHRYADDFDIVKNLGHNAHRFSIEWSRVEPEEGKFDEKEIAHYQEVVRALRARNIEPFVTLWHWTMPVWFASKGGWESSHAPKQFEAYVEKIVSALPEVRFWITLNEPEVWTSHAYIKGIWPPQRKNIFSYFRVMKNLVRAHRFSYHLIKRISPPAQVGIAKHNIYFEAVGNRLWNRLLKWIADRWWNRTFLSRIKSEQDFIGLNHYFHNRINWWFGKNQDIKTSELLGWELYPEGMYHALSELQCYMKPIYITENGLADARDHDRAWYITEILKNTHRAIKEGVDVRGYFHWSLLDNFEWDKGFWPRFGLVAVNYQTLARTIRPSAFVYKDIIENGLPIT